jgi:hypothetical protein
MTSEVLTMLESAATVRVRAGFRSAESDVVAGSLVEIEFSIENKGEGPFYLAVGNERSTLRPMFFSFAVSLENANVRLDDPAGTTPNLGGPVGVVRVEKNTIYRIRLLLNQFVRLEQLRATFSPGQRGLLNVTCRRILPLADRESEALTMESNVSTVEGTLQIRVHRDDAALERLITGFANDVYTATVANGARESALIKLIALRSESARTHLQSLAHDPDPGTQMLARTGLAALDRSGQPPLEES